MSLHERRPSGTGRDPLVSIIMPTHNYGHLIRMSVESLLSQSYPRVEVIIVDDGSTDGTADVLAPYGDRVRYLQRPHRGAASARNHGLGVAQGDYIGFLDADDEIPSDSIACRVGFLEGQPDLDVVFGDVEVVEGSDVVVPSFMRERRAFQRIPRESAGDAAYILAGNLFDYLVEERFITMPSVLVRRSFMDLVGGFDEAFPNEHDYDLWFRLARTGRFGYLDRVLARCHIHSGNLSGNRLRAGKKRIDLMHKLLREQPDLSAHTRALVARRLRELHFEVGYMQWEAGQLAEAHQEFARSLLYGGWRRRSLLYYFCTWLPPEIVCALRRAKHGLSAMSIPTKQG